MIESQKKTLLIYVSHAQVNKIGSFNLKLTETEEIPITT